LFGVLALSNQLIVLGVCANPEPNKVGAIFDGKSSIMRAYSRRPEIASLFETQ